MRLVRTMHSGEREEDGVRFCLTGHRKQLWASLCSLAASLLVFTPTALAGSCLNETSRQGPSAGLPDCRAYEQLTPANKGDSSDLFGSESEPEGTYAFKTRDWGYAAESGNEFLLGTYQSSFANGVSRSNLYVISRDTESKEWNTTAVSQPGLGVQSMEDLVFDPADFSQLAVKDLVGSSFHGTPELYNLTGSPSGPFTTIVSEPRRNNLKLQGVTGASADLSHIVVESRDHELAPTAIGLDNESNALYELVGGQLHLLDVNNEGSLLSKCGAVLGQGKDTPGDTHNAVSHDGSKVFFTAPDPHGEGEGCWEGARTPQENPPELYMRVNGTTVDISAERETGVSDPTLYPAVYVGASEDGSKVFFMTRTELTADDTGRSPELYEYDTEAPAGQRIVRISRGTSGKAEGNVQFVGAISGDGSTVYFAASGQLTEGLPPLGEGQLEEGQVYLYRYDTDTGKLTYIARVGSHEYPNTPSFIPGIWYLLGTPPLVEGDEESPVGLDARANWYTTANGQYLVFASNEDLAGYNSTPASGVACQRIVSSNSAIPKNCAEIYRYDATTNTILCVSCGPSGIAPVDDAEFARSTSESAPAGTPPRPVSEDGDYIFFDTASALVPQAKPGKLHVYEWHEGVISLISSPDDPGEAFFLGSSPDGANVFFGTHAQLVPQDTDASGDVYDARINGGFMGLAASECTGTGCQGVPAPPPIFATPAGVTFEGVGNFPPGTGGSTTKPKAKPFTRAQKLTKALKNCRRDRNKHKRSRCEASAQRKFGGAHNAKPTKSDRRTK